MSDSSSSRVREERIQRHAQVYSILDEICQGLELTESQYGRARNAYEAVTEWLAESTNPSLAGIQIYPHGSISLGTTVRPLTKSEYDVDLVALAPHVPKDMHPARLKEIVGDRLRDNLKYSRILEEKKRCWRLNYSGDFHLDISPTIPNPECGNGGELVPDRSLKSWHPTNPKAYRKLFEDRAELAPKITQKQIESRRDQASSAPFPAQKNFKGILRRAVQLLKHHRNHCFRDSNEDISPISIIITTLAMQAYEYCVRRYEFESEFRLLVETIRLMPEYINISDIAGRKTYTILNETTSGENFADRWNVEPTRADAFFQWHEYALSNFEKLGSATGIDEVSITMREMFGGRAVDKIFHDMTNTISLARQGEQLAVAPGLGLVTSPGKGTTSVMPNKFYGG